MSNDKTNEGEVILNMQEFNPKKAELQGIADKYRHLETKEIATQEDYEEIHNAQVALQKNRTFIKEQGLAIRGKANAFIDTVLTAEKELLSVITPLENVLIAKKKEWKDKKEKEEQEKREQQERITNERVQKLGEYGYIHDLFELKIMEDETFEKLLSEKKTSFENAQAEKEKERKAEERKNERQSRIAHIGMYYDSSRDAFIHPLLDSIFITRDQVADADDEQFSMILDNYSKQITEKREEQKKAQEELDRKKKEQDDREAELKKKEDDQKAKDDEKKRQDDLENARKQAEKDTEERMKKEADDKKKADELEARVQEAKRAKEKRYRAFLADIGLTDENKDEFTYRDTDEGRVFYKRVGIYLNNPPEGEKK